MQKPQNTKNGFSLIELLLVVAIISLLGATGSSYYRNFIKNIELQSAVEMIESDLRLVRSKSMVGEDGVMWGLHAVNTSGQNNYYELFSTPTDYANVSKSVMSTTTLSTGVSFSDPVTDSNKDIIFTKISGTTTATIIGISSGDETSTITISGIGTIY